MVQVDYTMQPGKGRVHCNNRLQTKRQIQNGKIHTDKNCMKPYKKTLASDFDRWRVEIHLIHAFKLAIERHSAQVFIFSTKLFNLFS